jgi:hypothetical protein
MFVRMYITAMEWRNPLGHQRKTEYFNKTNTTWIMRLIRSCPRLTTQWKENGTGLYYKLLSGRGKISLRVRGEWKGKIGS